MLHKENTPLKRAFLPRLTEVGASCPAALVKNLPEKTGLPNRTALAIRAARGNLFVIRKETDTETK